MEVSRTLITPELFTKALELSKRLKLVNISIQTVKTTIFLSKITFPRSDFISLSLSSTKNKIFLQKKQKKNPVF